MMNINAAAEVDRRLTMWFCFSDGFLSVVADKDNTQRLLVRARRKQDLLNVCGKDVKVIETARSDYRWRTVLERKAFAAIVAARIEKIDYADLKNSVKDNDLYEVYMLFSQLHRRYEEQDKAAANGNGLCIRTGAPAPIPLRAESPAAVLEQPQV